MYRQVTETHVNGNERAATGHRPDARAKAHLFFDEKQVSDKTPPCFLVHSSDDTGVPFENSILFAQALGVPCAAPPAAVDYILSNPSTVIRAE